MKTVAVTGGIGSGKSVVTRIFQTLGYPVYDCDGQLKRLYHEDDSLKKALCQVYGDDIYQGGRLRTATLAAAVFGRPDRLAQLNALTHPFVAKDFVKWRDAQTAEMVVLESAILFQSCLGLSFDAVIAVSAPEPLRIERVLTRPGMTPQLVRERMDSQLSDREICSRADYVVCNDQVSPLLPQIQHIISQIIV